MTLAPIASNIHETLNVLADHSAKIALDHQLPLNHLTKPVNLVFRE